MVIVLCLTLFPLPAGAAEPGISNLTYYDKVSELSDGMSRVTVNNKFGFIDSSGKLVINMIYDNAEDFHEGLAAISKGGQWNEDGEYIEGKWGFIDKTGKVIVPIIYDKVCDFNEGYAAVTKDNKLGFVNKSGDIVIPLSYGDPNHYDKFKFSEGIAIVVTGAIGDDELVYKAIKTDGSVVFNLKYEYAKDFKEGMLAVATGGYWGYGGGYYLACSYNDGKWGFIDNAGREIVSPTYDYVGDFNEGIAFVAKDGKFGAINKSGKVVVPIIYDDISNASQGLILVKSNNKWGYVDYTGKVVIPLKYDEACDFSEGLATASNNGYWGAIDKKGNTIIPFKYNNLWNFHEGVVRVKAEKGGKWGFLDKKGNMVIDPVYQAASDFVNGVAVVKKDNKFGVIKAPSISTPKTQHTGSIKANKQYINTSLSAPSSTYISSDYFKSEYVNISFISNDEVSVKGKAGLDKSSIRFKIETPIGGIVLYKAVGRTRTDGEYDSMAELLRAMGYREIKTDGTYDEIFKLDKPLDDGNYKVSVYMQNKGDTGYWGYYENIPVKVADGTVSFTPSSVYSSNCDNYAKNSILNPNNYLESTIYNAEEKKELKTLADKIIKGASNDYDKLLKIHDWVADNIYYDDDALYSGHYGATDAYGTYKNKKSVCQGYAELSNELLRLEGIPCRVVSGYAIWTSSQSWETVDHSGTNHAWNEAYVDGRWAIMDTTWDSSNIYENGKFNKGNINHVYFDPTLKAFSIDHEI